MFQFQDLESDLFGSLSAFLGEISRTVEGPVLVLWSFLYLAADSINMTT